MRQGLLRTGLLVAKIAFSVAVCAYVSTKIDWGVFNKSFTEVDLGWLFAALLALNLCSVVGALRWQLLLKIQGSVPPFWRVLSITFVGIFFNAFLLGSSGGDAARMVLAAQESPERKIRVAWSVLVDRLIGIAALLGVALSLLNLGATPENETLSKVASWSQAASLVLLLGCLLIAALPTSWVHRLHKHSGQRRGLVFISETLRALIEHRKHPLALLWVTGLSLLIVVLLVLTGWLLALALGVPISLKILAIVIPLVLIVISVPASIGGFGVREGAFVLLFELYQVGGDHASSVAVLYSLFWYILTFATSLVGACFFLLSRVKDAKS